jgi:hypothetical protein
VARLRHQGTSARLALADHRLGLAYAGADPARPSRRVNPRSRYRAMEQHFAATGRSGAGQTGACSWPAPGIWGAGSLVLTQVSIHGSYFPDIFAGLLLCGLGIGLAFATATVAAPAGSPSTRPGSPRA